MSKLTEEVKRLSRKLDNIDQRVEKIEEIRYLGDWGMSASKIAGIAGLASILNNIPKSTPPPAPPETKFKVGDKFIPHKPKDSREYPCWATGMDKYNGKTLTVSTIRFDGILETEGCKWYFNPSWCTKVEEPKPKFKKGDWVRSLITGTVGKVEAFYEDGSPFRYLLSTIDSKKFTSHESQLEPYFPREGEYAYIECESAYKYIIIYDHLGIRGETNHVFDKATVRLDSKCFWTNERPLCGLNEITEIRPATVEEKKLLDSKLAEEGLKFDGKEVVKNNTPKLGDFCIFWDDKETAICAILCVIRPHEFTTNEDFRYDNCVKFESEEQYKRVKEGK